MPLKLTVADLHDIPEALRHEYKARSDGPGFYLDIDGGAVPRAAVASLEKELDALKGRLQVVLIDEAVAKSALKLGAVPGALDDIRARVRGRFRLDDDLQPVATDADGNRIYGEDGKPLSVENAVHQLTAKAPHLFGRQGGAGAGFSGANPWAKSSWNVTAQMRIMKSDPEAARRLEAEASEGR